MRPKIETVRRTDVGVELKITPHPIFSKTVKRVIVTLDEMAHLQEWMAGVGTIQSALPDRPADFRELFLTGMDDSEWDKYVG